MITLTHGPLQLRLSPATGGAILSFTWHNHPVFQPVSDPRLAAQHGQSVAAYPLLPFANRVANGRFTWRGQPHTLASNFGGDPHPIHGNAWMRAWQVAEQTQRTSALMLDHRPARDGATHWPFAYTARQDFELGETALDVTLALRNTDSIAWPAGLGLHPYIARRTGTALRFDADTVWITGADGLPAAREAVSHHWDFATARPIGNAVIDQCYAGWGGEADVTWPDAGLTLRVTTEAPCDHLQLYTPAGQDFFGLEPVTNMPDAINRMDEDSDGGLKILSPGEDLHASIRFALAALPA